MKNQRTQILLQACLFLTALFAICSSQATQARKFAHVAGLLPSDAVAQTKASHR